MDMIKSLITKAEGIPASRLRNPEGVTPVGDGEKVLGAVPESIRPLWFLLQEGSKRYRKLVEQSERVDPNKPGKDRRKLAENMVNLSSECDLLHVAFWGQIERLYPEETVLGTSSGPPSLGIRENWQIVTCKPEPQLPSVLVLMGRVPRPTAKAS